MDKELASSLLGSKTNPLIISMCMKLLLASLVLGLASCSNFPTTKLPPGVKSLPKCQASPPQFAWTTSDGVKLPYLKALPAGQPKAVVIHVPGWDAVTGDYDSLTKALTTHGYAVYASENRSFVYGSKNTQGNAHDWKPWVADLKAFTKKVRKEQPGVRIVWHGQSFGSVQTLAALAGAKGDEAPDALIVHSPGYVMLEKQHGVLGWVAQALPWVKLKHIRLMDDMHLAITADPTWNLRWMWSEDRLRAGYTFRFLTQTVHMGEAARVQAPKIAMPVLAMWGGADKLGLGGDEKLRDAYNQFMSKTLSGSRTERFYSEKSGHMMHQGDGSQAVIQKVIDWLDTL